MSKKSNVHPDYYKTAGRDRPDDAARARLNRAIAAKSTSQQHPDRMGKLYFERPEPEPGSEFAEAPEARAQKTSSRAGATKKAAAKKTAPSRRSAPRKAAPTRKTASTRKTSSGRKAASTRKVTGAASTRRKKSGTSARPAKKR